MVPATSSDPTGGPPFSVEREDGAGEVVLVLGGELDVAGADQLLEAAREIPRGSSVVADLRGLTFMDSSGLAAIMNLDLRARVEGWSLTLAAPQPQVRRLLAICGVDERIPITDEGP